MKQYRKKPVVIQAVQLNIGEKSMAEVQAFTNGNAQPFINGCMRIDTMEGRMTAQVGDFIIKGVKGEFYPCKPDIFEATYEEVFPVPPTEPERK